IGIGKQARLSTRSAAEQRASFALEKHSTRGKGFSTRQWHRPRWAKAAIVPDNLHRQIAAVAFIEVVVNDRAVRSDLGVHRSGGPGFDAFWGEKIKCPAGGVEVVAAKVAKIGAAERPEIAPGHGEIGRMKRPRLARPKPQVPIQTGRNGWLFLRPTYKP